MKAPADCIVPAAIVIKLPLLATVMPPEPLAVHAAPLVMFAAVRLIPADPLVVIGPLKVDVLEPASCVSELAVIDPAVTLAADEIVTAPRGVMFPKAPFKITSPSPAAKLKDPAPLTVCDKRIFPAPAPVSKPPPAERVMGLEKEILLLLVVMTPAKKTGPVPFCV